MEFSVSMPGAFLPDVESPIRPTLTRTTANLFRPPLTPSAASSLSRSIHTIPYTLSGSRKRPRSTTGWCRPDLQHDPGFPTPSPLVDTRYRLAGASPQANFDEDEDKRDYRPNRFRLQDYSYFPRTTTSESGPHRRRRSSSQYHKHWGQAMLSLTGKVFNFCTTAFRGFYAGGGEGYSIPANSRDDVFNGEYHTLGPVPGQFPQESFIENYMLHPREDVPTSCQVADESITMRNNWVMVDHSPSRETRPVRRTIRSFEIRRSRSRSTMTRQRLAPPRSSNSNASVASPRRSQTRPSTSEGPTSPSHRSSRSSIASPRRFQSCDDFENEPPLSPDVKQFKKKVKKRERIQDESLRRLTAQTEDLLRLGREALGTSVNVQDGPDTEDEGYDSGNKRVAYSNW